MSPEADRCLRSPPPAARVVVIGFGSPIRGDDAFGPLVTDQLAQQLATCEVQSQVEILSRHILTAEMAESLRDAKLVIFVDAAMTGTPGEVVQRPLEPRRDTDNAFPHAVDAPGLLAWTEGLYGQAPPAILLSTRAMTFDYANYELSPLVHAAVQPTIDRARSLIREQLAQDSLA